MSRSLEHAPIHRETEPYREEIFIEDEVRSHGVDRELEIERICEFGGRMLSDAYIVDQHFTLFNDDLREHFTSLPRIRCIDDGVQTKFELTFKTHFSSTLALEHSYSFYSYEAAYAKLEQIVFECGLSPQELYVEHSLERQRTSLIHGNVRLDIDQLTKRQLYGEEVEDVSFVPTYVELEVIHELHTVGTRAFDALTRERDELAEKLGYELAPKELQRSLGGVIDYYKANPHLQKSQS